MSADYTWNHHIGDMVRGARNAAFWVLGVFKNRSTSVCYSFTDLSRDVEMNTVVLYGTR